MEARPKHRALQMIACGLTRLANRSLSQFEPVWVTSKRNEQTPVLAEGLEVTGNGTLNPLVVESFCNAIVHARIQNSLLLLILPPDGRQRVRRIFYFKRHLPTHHRRA